MNWFRFQFSNGRYALVAEKGKDRMVNQDTNFTDFVPELLLSSTAIEWNTDVTANVTNSTTGDPTVNYLEFATV